MVHDIRYTRVQRNIIILNKPTARRTHVRVIYSRKSRVGALRGPLEINLRQRSTFFNTQDFSITLSVVVPTWISHTRFQKLAKTIDIRFRERVQVQSAALFGDRVRNSCDSICYFNEDARC